MLKKILFFSFAFAALAILLVLVDVDFSKVNEVDEFDPSEGKVYCDSIPESLESVSNKRVVNATLTLLEQNIGDIKVDKVSTYKPNNAVLSSAEYRVVDRSLCLAYASGQLSEEKYFKLKQDILPLILKSAENIVGFEIKIGSVEFRKIDENKARAYIDLLIKSDSGSNETVASLIYGLVMVHDESKVDITGRPQAIFKECPQIDSCLGVTNKLASEDDPVLIRGGNDFSSEQIIVDFVPGDDLQDVRIYVEYYQRETRRGGICTRDETKDSPETGIPYLKEISSGGIIEDDTRCFYSRYRGTYKYTLEDSKS